jgi:hypothetical protein
MRKTVSDFVGLFLFAEILLVVLLVSISVFIVFLIV